jgi:hypothetical protein
MFKIIILPLLMVIFSGSSFSAALAAELNITKPIASNPRVQKTLNNFCKKYCIGKNSSLNLEFVGLNVTNDPLVAKVRVHMRFRMKDFNVNSLIRGIGDVNTSTCKLTKLNIRADNPLIGVMLKQMRQNFIKMINNIKLVC